MGATYFFLFYEAGGGKGLIKENVDWVIFKLPIYATKRGTPYRIKTFLIL